MARTVKGYNLSSLLKLLEAQKKDGRNQIQIANEIGITDREFRNWKNGVHNVEERDFYILAKTFNVDIGVIYKYVWDVLDLGMDDFFDESQKQAFIEMIQNSSNNDSKKSLKFWKPILSKEKLSQSFAKPIVDYALFRGYKLNEFEASFITAKVWDLLDMLIFENYWDKYDLDNITDSNLDSTENNIDWLIRRYIGIREPNHIILFDGENPSDVFDTYPEYKSQKFYQDEDYTFPNFYENSHLKSLINDKRVITQRQKEEAYIAELRSRREEIEERQFELYTQQEDDV